MIRRVMSKVLLRYTWMDKRLSVLEKECENEREKTEMVRELYAKRMQLMEKAQEEIYLAGQEIAEKDSTESQSNGVG